MDRPPGSLDPALFDRLLEEVGEYVFFMDFYNWGEPLLNPCVESLISRAAQRGIVCSLSTNLSLPLDDARIRRLVSSGLHELIVSLDGATKETYGQYRKGGDFDLVCANVRRLVAEKQRLGATRPLITWQFLVFRHNEQEQQQAQAMAHSMGVDRIVFRAPMLDTERPGIPPVERDALISWAPQDQTFRLKRTRAGACSWHYMSAAVNWDGSVAPCSGAYRKRDDFGTLADSRYMDVVNNASYRTVRTLLAGRTAASKALLCENCPVPSIKNQHRQLNRQIVMHTAVSLWQAMSGSPTLNSDRSVSTRTVRRKVAESPDSL